MPFCRSCGKETAPGAKFCESCGAPVDMTGVPPSPPPARPSPPPPPPPSPLQTGAPPLPPRSPRAPPGARVPPAPDVPPPPLPWPSEPPLSPLPAPPRARASFGKTKSIVAVIVVLVIIAGLYFVVLPKLSGAGSTGSGSSGLTQTPIMTPVTGGSLVPAPPKDVQPTPATDVPAAPGRSSTPRPDILNGKALVKIQIVSFEKTKEYYVRFSDTTTEHEELFISDPLGSLKARIAPGVYDVEIGQKVTGGRSVFMPNDRFDSQVVTADGSDTLSTFIRKDLE